ncbi:MAG TPA: helix-turn-helix domain-containing protein [Burkholderiaceae bacterium]|nr:helix-turn-helix domain-containing protein [Burkholderiaceae bacterium]
MTEPSTVAAAGSMYAPSPGALLRRARQAQGLHIAALAAALKVNPRKLEQLEGDQFDQLPDVAFARALAQAVCRHLKIDAQPVLALLPVAATAQPALERVTMGLNTPFREYSQRHESGEWPAWLQARIVVPALLVLAAVAFLLVPKSWVDWAPSISWPWHSSAKTEPVPASNGTVVENLPLPGQSAVVLGTGAEPVAEPASAPAEAAVPVAPAASTAVPAVAAALPVPSSAPLPPGMLALRAASESWVQVTDEAGDTLISRQLAAGEAVALTGVAPLRLTVGNAEGMQVRFKGRPVILRVEPDHTARAVLK